jgi:hypothetical protein
MRQSQDDPEPGPVDPQDDTTGIGATTEDDGQPFAFYEKLTVSVLAQVALHGVRNISSPNI